MFLLAAALASGCATEPVPVGESKVVTRAVGGGTAARDASTATTLPAFHVVERGDTLFSIAWRHGLDYRDVARLNGIAEPWVIRPGQKIRLRDKATLAAPAPAPAPAPAAPARSGAPVATTPPPSRSAPATAPVSPAVASPGGNSAPSPSPTAVVAGRPGAWQWPAEGKVLARFSASGSGPRGLAIEGRPGDPVRAARDGRVVYTGSGLVGYGQLVIVKHDDVFLSAYAHNSRLLVREGDAVRAGQVIAEMGSTGADRVKLHFEVRRNGVPVDPAGVLPSRP